MMYITIDLGLVLQQGLKSRKINPVKNFGYPKSGPFPLSLFKGATD